jgi:hypothetical protein
MCYMTTLKNSWGYLALEEGYGGISCRVSVISKRYREWAATKIREKIKLVGCFQNLAVTRA